MDARRTRSASSARGSGVIGITREGLPAEATRAGAGVPAAYHGLAAAFVMLCTWLALRRPEAYAGAMQEDRAIEWLTVITFAAAGIIGLRRAVRGRRVFDALVALFCLFVAGEEMSWGQRLLGITPPSYFLENNTQQEMNLHNFANLFGSPKGPFTLVLAGFGIALPIVALLPLGRRLLHRIGATPPTLHTIPWFAVSVILFVWYPFRFTGEWTELLAGSAFLMTLGVSSVSMAAGTVCALALAAGLAWWSARGRTDPAYVSCASAEVEWIAMQVLADTTSSDLTRAGSLHKRVWTLAEDGDLNVDDLRAKLEAVPCRAGARTRRRFAVDPWGTAYWLRLSSETVTTLTVYSFGPNRRRDMDASGNEPGDDVFFRKEVPSP